MRAIYTLAAATLTVAAFIAPAQAQTIQSLVANQLQSDGTFLWSYQVTSANRPAISHWVLEMCEDTFSSLVPGSVIGSNNYSFVNPDPTVGVTGIKFDDGYRGGESRIISFRLASDFGIEAGSATFKSGQNVTTVTPVAAPGCNTNNQIPEPATVALLGLAGVPLLGVLRRR
jgi:hypothetical protein